MRRIWSILLALLILAAPVRAAEDEKWVALTFDDGPSGALTERLLDGLAARDVKATFFVCGYRVAEYPAALRRIAAEGHEIGLHSEKHDYMQKMDYEEMCIRDSVNHNLQNRTIALVENGSWAPTAGGLMRAEFSKLKNCTILDETVTIKSSLKEAQLESMDALAEAIVDSMPKHEAPVHTADAPVEQNAMFSLSYGLFVLTARDGAKDNGCLLYTSRCV